MESYDHIVRLLDALRIFVYENNTVELRENNYFEVSVRSAFIKSFEFVDLAFRNAEDQYAFFLVPNLRGICEDLIILQFVEKLPPLDRETLIIGLAHLEFHGKVSKQVAFFSKFRPFQPVFNRSLSENQLSDYSEQVREIWKKYGWPNLRKGKEKPPTRQIAERVSPWFLEIFYDYIFRLTSGMVHFDPQILLRMGWGPDKHNVKLSTRHLVPYYLAFSRIYGAYLFCFYPILFSHILHIDSETYDEVKQLAIHLLSETRWPEMITFEEMNLPVPTIDREEFIKFLNNHFEHLFGNN